MSHEQLIQVSAALGVLIPFVLVQMGKLTPSARTYLVPNFVGSGILALDGALGHDWGFLLLEAVWSLVSLAGLVRTFTDADADMPSTHA